MLSCTKRLNKERQQLASTNDDMINLFVENPEQIRVWKAVVRGPPGSFYEGYEFDLAINVPVEYPMLPPAVKFVTKIFHPNVYFEVTLVFVSVFLVLYFF
jgi:ubiquitin-protein ligase